MQQLSATDSGLALDRLYELADVLDRGLAERGLTRAHAELLWRLHRLGPVTQRELSQALRCTPRNVTDLVDALEAAGLVARGRHPTDRRATLVCLTKQGEAAAARMRADHRKLATALFADLAAADLATFVSIVDRTLTRVRGDAGAT